MQLVKGIDKVISEKLIPFQLPGHKGRIEEDIYKYDLTEIEGTDNLSNPKEIILETMRVICDSFSSSHSFISVNGATGAVLGALSTAFEPGDEIIILRGSHISVYDGIFLLGLKPHYIYSDENVLERLKEMVNNNIKGVVLTSPNFYGHIVEDEVFEYIKEMDLTLIVDEAHGSHLKLIDEGLSSMRYADLVIHSFHKTLTSMTQTAVLHLCTNRFTSSYVQKNMKLFQSTSPNYLLMRSVDMAIDLYIDKGKEKMEELLENCKIFKERLEEETEFFIDCSKNKHDPTRLVIASRDIVDYMYIDKQLRQMGIQTEFASHSGLVLIPTIMSKRTDFEKLLIALKKVEVIKVDELYYKIFKPIKKMEIRQAYLKESTPKSYREAIGGIVTEYVIPYPPGTPIIVPGEILNEDMAIYLERFDGNILGLEHEGFLNILINDK